MENRDVETKTQEATAAVQDFRGRLAKRQRTDNEDVKSNEGGGVSRDQAETAFRKTLSAEAAAGGSKVRSSALKSHCRQYLLAQCFMIVFYELHNPV